jgi:hypothetical protein
MPVRSPHLRIGFADPQPTIETAGRRSRERAATF